MVKLNSSAMFLKDPVDMWGKEHTIGNAELAARLGSPIALDRRGSIVFYDRFESPTEKFSRIGHADSTLTLSTDRAFHGEASMKYVGTDAAHYETMTYKLADMHGGRVGFQVLLAASSIMSWDCAITTEYYDGTDYHKGSVAYENLPTAPAQSLEYYNTTGGLTEFSDVRMLSNDYLFTLIKIVVDLDNDKYVRCLIGGNEVDMSGIELYSAADPTNYKTMHFSFRIDGVLTAYIDNVVVTEEEQK